MLLLVLSSCYYKVQPIATDVYNNMDQAILNCIGDCPDDEYCNSQGICYPQPGDDGDCETNGVYMYAYVMFVQSKRAKASHGSASELREAMAHISMTTLCVLLLSKLLCKHPSI